MDSVFLELVRESLIAVVNEMRANMIYASYSSVIFEGHDFSCALMTADGRQLAQGLADHPIHIFAVPASTAKVRASFAGDIHPGDVFLHNDPYTGGTHLNDMLMLYPVFQQDQLIAFAACRAHWNDVGGMTPGSLSGRVTEIIQEGIRVPPIKIYDRGKVNEAAIELIFANMRVERERRGDFNCMLGTCRKAQAHMSRLCERFGSSEFLAAMDELITRAATRMRSRIAELPNGTYYSEGFIESNGHTLQPLPIRVCITVQDDNLVVDFAGTAPQVTGPTNAGMAMAANSVFTIAKAFLDPHTPINHGSFEPIRVIAPSGTIVNAQRPAPCGGMAEVKFIVDSVVAAALSQAMPEMSAGDVKGTANHVHITCRPRGRDDPAILYEWPAGGTGAMRGHDGSSVIRTFAEGDFNSIHAIEVVESSYPLRVRRSEIRSGSCGDGEFRGGFGLLREIEIMSDMGQLSVLSDRNIIPPYGVNGGSCGAPNRFTVVRGGHEMEPSDIPGKVSGFSLRCGDIVRERTAGGGGWGDPLKRDPTAVAIDRSEGLLTTRQIRARYGVVLNETRGIDAKATEALREDLRKKRIVVTLSIREIPRQMTSETRREALLAPGFAKFLNLVADDLIEIICDGAVPLRAWIKIDESIELGLVVVGSDAGSILRRAGEVKAELRKIKELAETFGDLVYA
jgi:N-methylhydantoinase B